jgi:hypothetical protein
MVAFDYIILGLLILLVIVLFSLISETKKLRAENQKLNEILAIKDTTIHNLEASRVAVKDVIENLSVSDEVMAGIEAGLSKEEISKDLGIPVSKIELIIKFDKIKKEQNSD